MYEELANILDRYSENHRLLDINAFEVILQANLRHEKGLDPFIKDIVIKPNEMSRTFGTYSFKDKIIKLYLDYIYKVVNRDNSDKEYRKKNEKIMQILQHEIEHAIQYLIANSLRNDIECNILRASILAQMDEDYYLANTLICPLERLAEIDSFLKMIEIVRKSLINNEQAYFEKVDEMMHCGYSENFDSSPTEIYITGSNIDSYFKFSRKFLENAKEIYSLEQRLRLGLRITSEDFNQVLNPEITLKRLKRRQ